MSDFTQQAFNAPERQENSLPSRNAEPNAFQDFAANLWGPPASTDQSGGISSANRVSFGQRSFQQASRLPEIPGVLTVLDGVTDAPKSEVTVQAKVVRLLDDFDNPRNGLKHEQFIVQTADGKNEFVAHDLNYAPRVPLEVGEDIQLKGEWIPTHEFHDGTGRVVSPDSPDATETIGVLHWTHYSEDENKHPSGYIEAGGQRYERN